MNRGQEEEQRSGNGIENAMFHKYRQKTLCFPN